jgi:ketosteroid isomerase-like protein
MQMLPLAVWLAVAAATESWNVGPTRASDVVRIDWSHVSDRRVDLAAVRGQYVMAVNAADAAGASAVYTTDAVALFGDANVLRGSAAVEGRLQVGVSASIGTVTLMPRQFAASHDVGSETGTYTVTMREPGEPGIEGAYISVYSRGADGRWRIAMEVRTSGSVSPVVVW